MVLGVLLELERQPRKKDRLLTGLALLGGLAVIASLVLSARSPLWKDQRDAEIERAERHDRTRLDSE
jgi:hypothetical protein